MDCRTFSVGLFGTLAVAAPALAQTTAPAITRCGSDQATDGRDQPAAFQSPECRHTARRSDDLLGSQRRPLRDVRIDRGLDEW